MNQPMMNKNRPWVVWSGAMAYALEKRARIVCGKEAPHRDDLTLHVEISHVDCMERHSWQNVNVENHPLPQALAVALLDVLKARPGEIEAPQTEIEKGVSETAVWAVVGSHLLDMYRSSYPFRLTVARLPGLGDHEIVRDVLELPYEDALRASVWTKHQWLGSTGDDNVDRAANTILGAALINALSLEPDWAAWNVGYLEEGLPELTDDSGVERQDAT